MSTAEKITEMQKRKSALENGGGDEKIKKHHDANKLTARERILTLFDEGSFIETDVFVQNVCCEQGKQAECEGVVTGYGTVEGRLVYAYSQDNTVLAGSIGKAHCQKITKIIDMAIKMGAPVVSLLDSNGARIDEGIDVIAGLGEIISKTSDASGVVPQICAVMGPVAGGESLIAGLSDFVVMVDKTSELFITGPSVLSNVNDAKITKEDYCDAKSQSEKSGNVHFTANNDGECLGYIKKLLSYLPANNLEDTPYVSMGDDINRASEILNTVIPDNSKESFDMKNIIVNIADNGEYFEVQAEYAKNITVGFIRLNGSTVGVVANNSVNNDGNLDINSADKAARFIAFCDCYNIAIVTFTDVAGFVPCKCQEEKGLIRHISKLAGAYCEATVPKVNIIVRKAYGSAYACMCSKQTGADFVLAWPTAEISVMNPAGAAILMYADELSKNGKASREEIIEKYIKDFANPYIAAKKGYVDDIIEPLSTRPRLIAAFEMLASKRENKPAKKHSNVPV